MIFYLDDYNLIRIKNYNELANSSLDILLNDIKIDYHFKIIDDYLEVYLNEDFDENKELKIFVNEKEYPLIMRFITHTKRFDEDYDIDLNILGSFLIDNKTIFRLFAPLSKKAYVVINNQEYLMNYLGKGLYELNIDDNLDGFIYHYKIYKEKIYEFNDPFAYLNKDNNDSYIIDVNKINKDKIHLNPYKNISIYEISVVDFSSDKNIDFKYKEKFLGLIEEGIKLDDKPVGFDYLKELNISHIQLMPVFSFDLDNSNYNWGYNPTSFNSLHQDYFVSKNPYEQLNEFKKVINTFHKYNIRINLDVVFNHVYRIDDFNLSRMIPYYFFRYEKDKLGNASFCGNETRSEANFLRKYLILLCKRFVEVFDIDGLRFDIMGILDIETMNGIKDECLKIKNEFLIYGEGWNMGDILPLENRAIIENASKLKKISFFNDRFRNCLRGKDIDDKKAYLLGDISLKEEVKDLLVGSKKLGFEDNQSINYVECHDNYTLNDKLEKLKEVNENSIIKLALFMTAFSKGIAFYHNGIEFKRTKKGIDNSYNAGYLINHIDWQRKNDNLEIVNYFKDLLKLKDELFFYYNNKVEESFEDYYEVLIYKLNNLCIFINPCAFDHIYCSDNEYEIIFDENGFNHFDTKEFKIKAFSCIVAFIK